MLQHTPSPYTYSPILKLREKFSLQLSFLYFVLSDYTEKLLQSFQVHNKQEPYRY